MQTLELLDWISIAIYFTILGVIAIWVIKGKKENTEDYFFQCFSMNFWPKPV